MYNMELSQLDKIDITNGVLSRLLTASHEMGKCALLTAGLKEVENISCSFVLVSLDIIREDLWHVTWRHFLFKIMPSLLFGY